ncbi:MAG: SAM-dependent methyltransferase, partial [Bacteroidales bacterium]|nr:SAM-dependent methyltransferase [Bacteroidales bacterium]
SNASIQRDKKCKGQFFTPLAISAFMGRLATPSKKKAFSVLDPGCGLAILSCALIEYQVEEATPEHIILVLYETDKKVLPFTKVVLNYLQVWCAKKKWPWNSNSGKRILSWTNVNASVGLTHSLGKCSDSRNTTISFLIRPISNLPKVMSIPGRASGL